MLALLLCQSVFATEPDYAPTVAAEATDAASKNKGGKNKGGGEKGGSENADDENGKRSKILGLNWEPYVAPGGGVQIDSSGGTAVTAGADVGIRYWKKKLEGNLYAGAAYITAENLSGYDVHLGNTTGYRAKYWGAGGGLEGTYNGQTNIETGKDVLAPALGVKVPVEITVGPKKYYAQAGVTPAWYFDESRKASAGGPVPFGDELGWHVAAGLKLGSFKGELGFAQLITSKGTYNTPTLAIGFAP